MNEPRSYNPWGWETMLATIVVVILLAAFIGLAMVVNYYFPHFFDLLREAFDHCKQLPYCCDPNNMCI